MDDADRTVKSSVRSVASYGGKKFGFSLEELVDLVAQLTSSIFDARANDGEISPSVSAGPDVSSRLK